VSVAATTLVLAAGIDCRADPVYTYTTPVEITSPVQVGPDAAVSEAFGHQTENPERGTTVKGGQP
jgi:hypothetical protein